MRKFTPAATQTGLAHALLSTGGQSQREHDALRALTAVPRGSGAAARSQGGGGWEAVSWERPKTEMMSALEMMRRQLQGALKAQNAPKMVKTVSVRLCIFHPNFKNK